MCPVYQDKQTKRLFIQFTYRGETYKERLPKDTTRRDAEKLEIRIKNRMMFERHGVNEDGQTDLNFERFIQDYYLPHVEANHSNDSFEKAINICKAALPFFKGRGMRQIKPADVERFKTSRTALATIHGKARKPATVARELAIISRIFSMAVRNDLCDYNPCSRVEKPKFDNVQDRILKREDEEKFFAAFDAEQGEWAKDICRIVLHTGLRQNDVLGLTKFNVDLQAGIIRITQGKTTKRLDVMMNETVKAIVERRMKGTSVLLFPSPKTGELAKSVRKAMTSASRRAKIERLTIRDLRRTCATRLDEMGFSSATIAKFLGHRDLRSVHRYQRGTDILREAAEALDSSVKLPTSLPKSKAS